MFFLPERLNDHNYRRFLEEDLPIMLEVPISVEARKYLHYTLITNG